MDPTGLSFDAERFISEIESRPPLWDTTLRDYVDKDLKKKLWEEIVVLFKPTGLTEDERKLLGANLQKKWKNIRDCYGREIRRLKEMKLNGSTDGRKSSYIYFENLSFLRKCFSLDALGETTSKNLCSPRRVRLRFLPIKSYTSTKKIRTHEKSVIEPIVSEEENTTDPVDDDKLFLLSLLPEMKKVPEGIKLLTKMELMRVIQKAQKHDEEDYDEDVSCLFDLKSDIDIQETELDQSTEPSTSSVNDNERRRYLFQENKHLREEIQRLTALTQQQSTDLLLFKQNEEKLSQMVQAVKHIVNEEIVSTVGVKLET